MASRSILVFAAVVVLICGCILQEAEAARVKRSSLSDDDKAEILRAHNHFRGMVNPISTNMERMEWHDELAALAQFWASGCELMENEDRNSQSSSFDYVGEVMDTTLSYTVNYTIIAQKWFQEGRYYDYFTTICTDADGDEDEDGESCQRYKQLVWARSAAVGCGAYRCEEVGGAEDGENALFVVCYYGPGGNFYGESPYQTGAEVCTACPTEKPFCVGNLCSESGAPPVVSPLSLLGLLLVLGAANSLI